MAHGTDDMRKLRDPALLAWLRLARITGRTHRDAAGRLRAAGLSNAQFDVLAQVSATPGLTQQALAARLLVTQGNVCQLLDGLGELGLVERRRDGRRNRLHLTPEGRELADSLVPEHEAWNIRRLSGLTRTEQGELLSLLGKLDRAQRRAESKGDAT